MKAILVIDMPNSCEECDYCGFYQDDVDERACMLMEGYFIGKLTEGERDVCCPLKPIPDKAAETLLKGLSAMEKMQSVEVRTIRRTE